MTQSRIPEDEAHLIQRSQRGDRQAFAALVNGYWDRLYRWLYHMCHDRHAAEDLTQETLMRAFSALPTFDPQSFQGWLFRIAFNCFSNLQRDRKKNRQSLTEDVPGRETDPAEMVLTQEAMRHLTRGVGRLPSEFRGAFLLRVEEDLSYKEIGQAMGVSEETARWRVFKARQKLMEILEPFLGDFSS